MDLEKPSKGRKQQVAAKNLEANDQKRLSVLQTSKTASDALLHQLITGKFDTQILNHQQEAVLRAIRTEGALQTDKNHSLASLFSAYVNLRVNSGLTLEEVFTEVSRTKDAGLHQSLLQNLFAIPLLSPSNGELVELFTFLQYVLTNNHLEVCASWTTLVFSNNIWLVLSKLYLRDLLSTYNGYIDQYAQLSKKQLSPLEKAASEFLPKVLTLFGHKFESLAYDIHQNEIDVCEKILEFLLVSLSTPQSRLATVQLMQDKQFYIKNSMFLRHLTAKEQLDKQTTKNLPEFENLWQSLTLIKRFINYGLEGESKVARRTMMVHYDTFQEFQRLLFHHFGEKVSNYVIKSVGNLDNREKMTEIFSYLDEADLRMIASKLHIFIPEDDDSDPILSLLTTEQEGFKPIIEEILIYNLRATESILSRVRRDPLYPTQRDIWQNPNRIYSPAFSTPNRHPASVDLRQTFPVDRITNSFVNIEDYLIRYFYVLKHQSALECRQLLEDTVAKVAPQFDPLTGVVKEFAGWSSESLEVKKFTIYEVEKPKIGKTVPEKILAEIYYSTVDLMNECKARWEFLREYETLFLLSFNKRSVQEKKEMINELDADPSEAKKHDLSYLAKTGLTQVRGARLIAHLDEDRKKINISEFRSEVHPYGTIRYLQIHLDPNQYNIDTTGTSRDKGNSMADSVFSLVVKRSPEAPNYLNYMNLILKFLESGRDLPNWVNSVVIGKKYSQGMYMPRKPEDSDPIKLFDVFSNEDEQRRVLGSVPFLKNYSHDFEFQTSSRNSGHKLSWNLAQKQAIAASTYPGLLLVSGCLGTGKTSLVAEMTLQNLSNYPEERILIISRCEVGVSLILQSLAKSGQIQDDLLIRLGNYDQVNSSRSSPEIDTEILGDFTKYGRVNFMLKLRLEMLAKIESIAKDVNPNINGGFTCETAQIFYQSQLESRFATFKQEVAKHQAAGTSSDQLPDYPFLQTAVRLQYPQLAHLQDKASKEWINDCTTHFSTQIGSCFVEMAKTRVLELLRIDKERGNYLLNYHSKVILMTPETLLDKHEELFDLKHPIGTLIIDEAQQITDFESFAALAVAKSLKRVVLLADKLHEPPNIKNPILKEVSGLNKSMFERLSLLGYPEIKLTQHYSYDAALSQLCKAVSHVDLQITEASQVAGDVTLPGLAANLQFVSLDSGKEVDYRFDHRLLLRRKEFRTLLKQN